MFLVVEFGQLTLAFSGLSSAFRRGMGNSPYFPGPGFPASRQAGETTSSESEIRRNSTPFLTRRRPRGPVSHRLRGRHPVAGFSERSAYGRTSSHRNSQAKQAGKRLASAGAPDSRPRSISTIFEPITVEEIFASDGRFAETECSRNGPSVPNPSIRPLRRSTIRTSDGFPSPRMSPPTNPAPASETR